MSLSDFYFYLNEDYLDYYYIGSNQLYNANTVHSKVTLLGNFLGTKIPCRCSLKECWKDVGICRIEDVGCQILVVAREVNNQDVVSEDRSQIVTQDWSQETRPDKR